MTTRLSVLLVVLLTTVAFAQTPTPPDPLVRPTTNYTLAWDHDGLNLDHFEVRYDAATAWIKVTPAARSLTLPAQAVGAHTAQVRACPTISIGPCSDPASLTYTVVAPKPTSPSNIHTAPTLVTPSR